MSQRKSLVIIGGCSLEVSKDGGFKTKTPLSKYFFDICGQFDEVKLYAPISHTNLFSGSLNHPRLEVYSIGLGSLPGIVADLLFGQKKHLLLHLPNASFFAPFLPLLKWRLISSGVYLGIDFTYQPESQGFLRTLRWKVFRAMHRLILRNCDFVIARGNYLAAICSALNAAVFETVPLGHMSSGAREGIIKSDSPTLLFVGKVMRRKGIDVLLDALHRVNAPNSKMVRLDVVGDGDDLEWAAAEAARLGLADRVQFHGWIDDTERLESFWGNASALIVPTSTSEGVPRVIEEAVIRDIPVIATKVGGIVDQFKNGEIVLIPPNEPATMAAAIESTLFNDEVRQRQVAAIRSLALKLKAIGSAGEQHARLLLGEETK